jgi:branched-chain amino acid transport system substrate-binding protein
VGAFVSFFREAGVEVVFIAGVAPSGRVVLAETRRQGFRGAVLGNDSWLALVGDPVAEGAYIAARFSMLDSRPEVAAFTRAFRERYGTEPDNFAAYMYDATRVLARAIEAAGTDRAAVRAWLAGLAERGPHPGVTGPVAFTATGDPVTRRFVLMQVRDGRLALIGESD